MSQQAQPSKADTLTERPGGRPLIKLGAKSSARKLSEDSGEKVCIGCKIPSGLVLHLDEMVSVSVQVLGGGVRDIEQSRPIPGETIRLNGCRAPWGENVGHEIKHNAGLTFNVPKAFWDKWCEDNEGSPLLENGVLTVERDRKSLVDILKDERERKSGLEPLIPDTDPRIPKNRNGKPAIITKDDDE